METVVKLDRRKKEKRRSPYHGFTVLDKTMNVDELELCNNHYMFDDYHNVPKDLKFGCWTANKEKALYKGKPTIICEHINLENRTIFVKMLQFDDEETCNHIYYTMTDNR